MRSLYVCGFVALCLHIFHIRIVSVCLIRISGLQGRAARRLHERDEGVLLDHRFDSADRIDQRLMLKRSLRSTQGFTIITIVQIAGEEVRFC